MQGARREEIAVFFAKGPAVPGSGKRCDVIAPSVSLFDGRWQRKRFDLSFDAGRGLP